MSKKNKELLKQINEAFDKQVQFLAKYGNKQGARENNKELYWYGTDKPETYGSEDDQFIMTDISRSELIYARFVKVWKELNRTAFGEEWKGDIVTKGLKDRIEDRLFNGQVALFKHPITGDIVAESFSFKMEDLNCITNLPDKIIIESETASINGLELSHKDCAIGFNTSSRVGELAYDMPQLEMIINSYMSLAMTIKRSKPKTFIAGMDDDTLASDIKRAVESDSWVEFLNISAKQLQQLDIRFENDFKGKMEMIMGTVADFIKFKGFNTNGYILKRERQSETELDNNDEFKHYLVFNKIMERKELAEQAKKNLDINIEYSGDELLKELRGETECQDQQQDKKTSDKESPEK